MGKKWTWLVLLILLVSGSVFAEETKKSIIPTAQIQALPTAYQRFAVEDWERLNQRKGNMNHLQTVPVIDRDDFQLDLGPGQFQFRITF